MKRMAFFVEGQTEALFVQALTKHLAKRGVRFVTQKKHARKYLQLGIINTASTVTHEILICDCSNDEQVKTSVVEQAANLEKNGYSLIIGLRDLHPEPSSNLKKIKANLAVGLPNLNVAAVRMVLAIREIEAWFIQEGSHFQKIDQSLTRAKVISAMNFDYLKDSAETIQHPADFLQRTYKLAQKTYNKSRNNVLRTLNALDYSALDGFVARKSPSVSGVTEPLKKFLI